jgi:predicted metal-binding membrane protein
MRPGFSYTWLERGLRHDDVAVLAIVGAIAALSWGWIIAMGIDMYGSMTGASAWAMAIDWDGRRLVLLFAMWTVMMVAMMLPSAAPFLLVYGGVARSAPDPSWAPLRIHVLAAGYLVTWAGFSAVATGLQYWLSATSMLTPMMQARSPLLTGVFLLVAGVYQLTPAKGACLSACRSTAGQVVQHWRPGTAGAFHMGIRHGLFCVGCCWALMLLLFAGGVMHLLVIASLSIVVAVEKLTPIGPQAARISGGLLVAFGLWIVGH